MNQLRFLSFHKHIFVVIFSLSLISVLGTTIVFCQNTAEDIFSIFYKSAKHCGTWGITGIPIAEK